MGVGQMHTDPIAPSAGREKIFDPTQLLSRLGGDREIVVEVIEMFLNDCPVMLRDIRDAITGGDAGKLESNAHKLRGAIGHLTTTRAYEQARSMEAMGKTSDFAGAARAVTELEMNVDQLVAALKHFCDSGAVN